MPNDIDIKSLVRTIPDYPKPGIMFRDVTTILGNAHGLRSCVEAMAAPYVGQKIDAVAAIEARGFIFGGAIAERLGCAFVPIRKKGKLPWKTLSQEYQLEYGRDTIEIHVDAVAKGQKILLVDDLIATGGTAEAAAKLIEAAGGTIAAATFVIDLPDLGGRALLERMGIQCHVLMTFAGH